MPNIIYIKSVTIEHPKTSPKLSNTLWQAKKNGVGKNSTTSFRRKKCKTNESITCLTL